jgi:iron(III) transport system permease protein
MDIYKESVDARHKAGHDEALMTIAISEPLPRAKHGFDYTRTVLYGFAAVLVVLIVLPMSWLVYYGFTTPAGAFTLSNFYILFSEPTFQEPLITTFILATSTSLICCIVAAPMGWLVARTNMPLRRTTRLMVTASFVTPPFLGAIAWELLAAPNSGLINQGYRWLTGASADFHLFNIYSFPGLIFVISCYTFPYVFVLVANALERMPGELEDASSILGGTAWDTARRVTVPLALPAVLAGALVAFLQAMTLFGSPAILALPAGFHTMTTKIWSLFQYPPKPELAAAASLPLLVLTVMLLRAEHMILGRRGYSVIGGKNSDPRIIQLGFWRWPAMAFCFFVLLCPVFLPYGALFNATFSSIASKLISFDNFTLRNINFVLFELSATKLAFYNTFVLGITTATLGTVLALVISYLTTRQAVTGHRALGFLATAPVAIPGIVLGVGLFLSYTRPPFVLYGTLWILLLAFLTLSLPAAYQQLQSAFRAIHPELEDASRILGATRLRALREITAPLLRTSVIATWCFVFVGTIRELSAAIMLFTSETKVLSVLIFDLNESGDLAAISVLGIIMLVVTFGIVALANRLRIGGGPVRLRNY